MIRIDDRNLANVVRGYCSRAKAADASHCQVWKCKECRAKWLAESKEIHDKMCDIWEGTESGLWFSRHSFDDWLYSKDSHPILWLTGRSGIGKSVLMSRLVEEARARHPSATVVHYYCLYNDIGTQDLRNILGSLLAQMLKSQPKLLNSYFSQSLGRQNFSVQLLEEWIIQAAEDVQVLLVLDGCNESSEADQICKSIMHLVQNSKNIRAVVSATPNIQVPTPGATQQFHLTSYNTMIDMTAHVERQVYASDILRTLPREHFAEHLLGSDCFFHWLDCQMQVLALQYTKRLAIRALQDLPGNLDSIYVRMLRSIPVGQRSMAKEALAWLAFSARPLTLDELNEADVFEETDTELDDDSRFRDKDALISSIHGLINRRPGTNVVTLAHQAVHRLLTGDSVRTTDASFFYLDEVIWHRTIVRKCLRYLLMRPFNIECDVLRQLDPLFRTYPLLRYASTRWHYFAGGCSLEKEELDIIETFFLTQRRDEGHGSFKFWIATLFQNLVHLKPVFEPLVLRAEPLYYAASYGLKQIVDMLLERNLVTTDQVASSWYIDHKCGRGDSTALQAACFRGHSQVLKCLLTAGADPNSANSAGYTNLFFARSNGHEDCEQLLISFGALGLHVTQSNTDDGYFSSNSTMIFPYDIPAAKDDTFGDHNEYDIRVKQRRLEKNLPTIIYGYASGRTSS